MLKRLAFYLLGHLRIRVTGTAMERFLNLALAHGLLLWRIDRKTDQMRVSLTVADFRKLRPVAHAAHCRIHILSRHGLPFKLARLKHRPLLILGALACLAFLIWGTGHIWIIRVRITGPQALDPRAVEAVAGEAGLKFGAWKNQVDLKRVQQHIEKRMGEVSWAIVRVQGTRATVEVVEKASPGPEDGGGCVNLVAEKAGLIEQVIPFRGEPVVKKGDVVRPGDLLVECSLRYYQGGRPMVFPGTPLPTRESVARTLVAQALVKARITYRRYQLVPLLQEQTVPTGRTRRQWVLNWKDKPIIRWGNGSVPFGQYRTVQRAYPSNSWRNWLPPVELVMISAEETEVRQERVSADEAVLQARQRLEAELRWAMSPSDRFLTPVKAEIISIGSDFAEIRTYAETLEEISIPQAGSSP